MKEKIGRYILKGLAAFVITSIGAVILFRVVNPPVTFLMLRRVVEQKMDGKAARLEKDWVSIDEISSYMVQAVVASEDNNFIIHRGIDFDAIRLAKEYNKKSRFVRGASTITQQTAKNVFLWPRRSYVRKAMEAYFTSLVEIFWSKKRIMEVYLNVVEMGNGIYGVEAASEHYFGKKASQLNADEAAMLAAILPSPRKRNPAKPSEYLINRKNQIRGMMINVGKIDL